VVNGHIILIRQMAALIIKRALAEVRTVPVLLVDYFFVNFTVGYFRLYYYQLAVSLTDELSSMRMLV